MSKIEFEKPLIHKVETTATRVIKPYDTGKSIGPFVNIEDGEENKHTLYITTYFHTAVEKKHLDIPTEVNVENHKASFTITNTNTITNPTNERYHWEIVLIPKENSAQIIKNLTEIEVLIDFNEKHPNNSGNVSEPKRATRVIPT